MLSHIAGGTSFAFGFAGAAASTSVVAAASSALALLAATVEETTAGAVGGATAAPPPPPESLSITLPSRPSNAAFVRSSSRIRSLSASFSETGCDTAGGAAAAAVATAAAAAGAACVTGDAGVLRDTFGSSGTGVPNIQRRKRTAGGASMILWTETQ